MDSFRREASQTGRNEKTVYQDRRKRWPAATNTKGTGICLLIIHVTLKSIGSE